MLRIAIARGKPSRPLHYQFIAPLYPRFLRYHLVFNAVSQSIKIYRRRFIHLYLYPRREKLDNSFFPLFSTYLGYAWSE